MNLFRQSKVIDPEPQFSRFQKRQSDWFNNCGEYSANRGLPQSAPARQIWPLLAAAGDRYWVSEESLVRLATQTNELTFKNLNCFRVILRQFLDHELVKCGQRKHPKTGQLQWLYQVNDVNQIRMRPTPTILRELSLADQINEAMAHLSMAP